MRIQARHETNRNLALAAGVTVAALLLGGGGVAYGLPNALVQLVAIFALGVSFATASSFTQRAPNPLLCLLAATVALPAIQMLPLPPALWQALPGRELITSALAAAGLELGWRPVSVHSARTLVALLALIVPLVTVVLAFGLSRRRLQHLGWIIVGLGLVCFIWGVPQVLSEGGIALPYPENPMPGVLFGSFANRNSTALFLVICLILALNLSVIERYAQWSLVMRGTLAVIFTTGVVLTQSRTGIALLLIPLGMAVCRYAPQRLGRRSRSEAGWAVGLGVVLLTGVASTAVPDSRIGTALDRFSGDDGFRTQIWEDALFTSDRYWPIGSGMGTFDEVFQVDESLEYLSPRTAGRAHNDYLELMIEGGLPALVILAAWLCWLAWFALKARSSIDRWIAWSGSAILFAILAQSLLDYPLRNLALLNVTAFAIVVLARFSVSPRESKP
ncbi:hypothetical protein BPTFM16_01825 [Altererythrobacter insulae]|nr:hypothetical protein BPTFM16_01825 [Altererythrobacter insulae]